MKIQSWHLYRYALPFHPPWETREGLLLQLRLCDDRVGWGEIAPLPGKSRETLQQAQEQITSFLLQKRDEQTLLFPSVQWGLEQALRAPSPQRKFPLCALLWGTPETIRSKAAQVYEQGFRTIKVKISNLSDGDAQELLKDLQPHFQIRIDLNRTRSFKEACALFSPFDPEAFAFIEEPTYELGQLPKFPHRLALDESLLQLSEESLDRLPTLQALVIKPTLIGGREACRHFQQISERLNTDLIISSACESGLGIAQICALADELRASELPLGLDTYRFLQEDVLEEPLDFSHAELLLPPTLSFNFKLLKEVACG